MSEEPTEEEQEQGTLNVVKHEEFDSSSDEDENDAETSLQIGFVEKIERNLPMFTNLNWSTWDGGKIGGRPFWLDPEGLPSPQEMECSICKDPLTFLMQIYCPLDDNEHAFHRMLYLFCCQRGECSNNGSVVALRCQLARENKFYSSNSKSDEAPVSKIQGNTSRLCFVCGQKGPMMCTGCRNESYCSKSHQKVSWVSGHKARCTKGNASCAQQSSSGSKHDASPEFKCLFPCFDISVEEETDIREECEEEAKLQVQELEAKRQNVAENEDEALQMASLRQSEIIGREDVDSSAMRDPITFRFQLETSFAKNQILRYNRWSPPSCIPSIGPGAAKKTKGGPLWIKTEGRVDQDCPTGSSIPPCENCGAARRFEFQVMPQLLYFLRVEERLTSSGASTDLQTRLATRGLDWGVLVVFTCTQSCNYRAQAKSSEASSGYIKEFVWRQSPL